jgi:hypothetical protein
MLLWKPLLVGDVYIGVEVGCAYHGGVKLIFWRGRGIRRTRGAD